MKTVSDVIVIGGGPCGSFAALNLAKRGVNVTVFEEHSEIGVPCHCPGHVSLSGLERLGLYPLPANVVENLFYGANFYSPRGGKFQACFPSPVTCVINRVLFDRHIAKTAEKMGAQYCFESRVDSPILENGFVKGVRIKRNDVDEVFSKIVVDAEGVSSRILRMVGLPALNRNMLANGVEAEVENVEDVDLKMVDVYLGTQYASGFYAWLIPTREGIAKVGLAAKTGNPKWLLEKLMCKHPVASKKLRRARILQSHFHPLTLGGFIPNAYSSGLLAVGDAASQVKPTTGGGLVLGMASARLAAEVASEALRRSDFSSRFLNKYQRRCDKSFGFDVSVMLRIRKMLNAMSDEKIDKLIRFCSELSLDKAFQNIGDVDFQGRSLLRLLRNPRMWYAFFYFFSLYLSANY